MTDPNTRLNNLFESFTRSAFRWECQGEYAIDADRLQAWREGRPQDMTAKAAWLAYIRSITAAGKRWERVRMVPDPVPEYLLWLYEQTDSNVAAGEDIRWIDQAAAATLEPPDHDFYLFDGSLVAVMNFGPDMLLADLKLVDDPTIVGLYRNYQNAVWRLAVRHAEYSMPAERGT